MILIYKFTYLLIPVREQSSNACFCHMIIALTCLTPDQSKPCPNLPGAHVARAQAIRAPCRVRVCVWGRGGQPPGPSHLKFEPPRVRGPAAAPRAIPSRSGDAKALLGLESSASGAPDEVRRSCSRAWACGP
jgi:hypothetical protein